MTTINISCIWANDEEKKFLLFFIGFLLDCKFAEISIGEVTSLLKI
jgi:hypothetical protein